MTIWRPLSKKEIFVVAIGAAIVMIILIAAFLPYGRLRVTYDSQDLIDASKSLETYLTTKNKDGHSYLVRAPLHPFLLSFFQQKMLAMWWINLLSFVASLFVIYKICREKDFSTLQTTGVVAVTTLFYPWLMNFQFFWTEAIFILLILILCYALLRNWNVFAIVLICAFLFLTRKPGIFFFASGAAIYFLDKKWLKAAIVSVAAVIVFVSWQWLEFANQSTGYFGVMLGTLDQYQRIFYADALASWFLPMTVPLLFRTTIVLVIFIVTFYSFRKEIFSQFQQKQNVVLLSVAGVYTVIFISFTGATGYEDAERFLNVVFPLWIILAVSILTQIIPSQTKNVRIFVLMVIGFWLLYTFLRTAHHLAPAGVLGEGLN